MKKIINERLYDTATADKIAEYSYGDGTTDFKFFDETLYRKKNGEFFIHGVGGPLSHYRTYSSANSWGGAEKIIPMDEEEAKDWLEAYADAEAYISVFGEPAE